MVKRYCMNVEKVSEGVQFLARSELSPSASHSYAATGLFLRGIENL